MTQSKLLIEAFKLVVKSGLFPDTPLKEWVPLLLFLHKKGFLWAAFEKDKVVVVCVAYKVKEVPQEFPKNYPDKEEGNILYIPWMISVAEDKFLPKKLLTSYLNRNPGIEEIAFHDLLKQEIIRHYRRKPKETENGKEERKPGVAGDAGVLSGSKVQPGS